MSAMECANHCGPLYQRDGQWWCLNNYCEHSYFWERKRTTNAQVTYTTSDGAQHTQIVVIAQHPIVSVDSIRICGIDVPPENITVLNEPTDLFQSLVGEYISKVLPIQEAELDLKRIQTMGINYTRWSGRPVCRICDRPLTNCDSWAACPDHCEFVRGVLQIDWRPNAKQ